MRTLDRGLQAIACALLLALLLIVLSGVVSRAANAPLIWTDEGARFVMVWLASFGWMIATRRQAHVRIRYFQGLLPASLYRLTERAIQAALMLFGVVVAWYGVGLVMKNLELEATSLPLSMALLYVPIIPAGLVMALQGAAQVISANPPPRASPPSASLIGEAATE